MDDRSRGNGYCGAERAVDVTAAYGVSWNDGKAATRAAALAMVALMAAAFVVPAGSALSAAGSRMVSVIVRAVPGTGSGAEHAVHEVNGHVGQRIGIINGFAARVPARDIARVQVQPGVASITPNAKGHLLSTTPDYSEASDGY
ncbi:MAG: hypothetical protein QOG64_2982, partial [Acidimicrobiaceae bacterium]|nr:hypothetical protein [Acidimicrobiaceae bacterium]